ncbi:Ligand-gated channel [Alteromonas sp. 38]|uniref:TonB-dependent receptor n=1 Tax=unclassified Alteromonas TaxID=2614992 RepID=UPI0012F01207|nr:MULTISPECIES: TonB-dependent receptor [unclassified Alteromonas]CAD5254626.1 Ligand-gated channel [Alteromonas sp. 154]VXB02907.1 Ligand-gated channel [Alteromonas sp. 38]
MKNQFAKTTLSLSVLAGLTGVTPVTAQQSSVADENVEVIEVTSFRSSLIRAKDLKKDAIISRDTILAEDIADFPDLNLADSLQRVPGITITREGGEGRQISLRGLGPDFTRVQVNGMEAMGTSSSPMDARGGVSRTRGFDFNVFASELFNRIDISKTYSADQEEGGIGGTVGLFTAKPFDYDGFKSALSVRGGYNTNSEETNPRMAGLISNVWNKFGALVSVAYSERETAEYGTNTTRWRREGGKTAADPADTDLQAELDSGELWFPRGHRFSRWNNTQDRLGVTAAFQYKLSDSFSLTLDIMHAELENNTDEHHSAVKDNKVVSDLIWEENDGQKEVVYALYENATWRNENSRRYNESEFNQYTLSMDWTINPEFYASAVIGTSSSDFDQPEVIKSNIHAKGIVDIATDFRQDRFYGISTSSDFDTTQLDGYEMKDIYLQENYITNDFDTAKVDFTYLVGDTGELQFGVNYKKFENSAYQLTQSNAQNIAPENTGVTTLNDVLVEVYSEHPNTSWLQGDLDALLNFYGLSGYNIDDSELTRNDKSPVTEETLAMYVQYGWENEFAGKPLLVSAGLRYFETDITAAGKSSGAAIETTRSYSDVLPTINLVYELQENVLWRASASKNITRPSLGALSYNASVSQTSGDAITSVTMGNPMLEPFESNNLDTAFEWYFDDVGYAAAAIFYKDIDNFIVDTTSEVVYSSLGLPAELLPVDKTVDSIFYLQRPENMDASKIKGVELTFSRDLDFLPAPFNHLGVIANYTYADGDALYRNIYGEEGNDQEKAFTGLSKNSYNFTLYYEQEGWGARVSAAYRSAYLTGASSSGDQDESGYHGTTFIDFSSFYQLTDTIKLSFEGINLTDERQELYSDSHDRAYNTTTSGRTYMLGATMQF